MFKVLLVLLGLIFSQTTMAGVTIFTANGCPPCQQVKQLLNSYSVKYKELNIDNNSSARRTFEQRGYIGTPVTIINGVTVVGYEPATIRKLLKRSQANGPKL